MMKKITTVTKYPSGVEIAPSLIKKMLKTQTIGCEKAFSTEPHARISNGSR